MEERNKGSERFQGQGESSAGQERKQKMAPPKIEVLSPLGAPIRRFGKIKSVGSLKYLRQSLKEGKMYLRRKAKTLFPLASE